MPSEGDEYGLKHGLLWLGGVTPLRGESGGQKKVPIAIVYSQHTTLTIICAIQSEIFCIFSCNFLCYPYPTVVLKKFIFLNKQNTLKIFKNNTKEVFVTEIPISGKTNDLLCCPGRNWPVCFGSTYSILLTIELLKNSSKYFSEWWSSWFS